MFRVIAFCLLLLVAVQAHSWEHDDSIDHESFEHSRQLDDAQWVAVQEEMHWPPVPAEEMPLLPAPMQRSTAPRSADSLVPANRCPAPQNGGIRQLLREIRPLLPRERLKQITKSALKRDPQVRSLRQLTKMARFRANVRAIRQSREFGQLRQTACRRLYLDLQYYGKFVHDVIHMHFGEDSSEETSSSEHILQGRPGFAGLCQDLIDALPRAQIRAVYNRRYENDPELRRAVQTLKSQEFKAIVRDIQRLREYQENRRMIANVGVRLEDMQRVIDNAMGWRTGGRAAETTTVEHVDAVDDSGDNVELDVALYLASL